MSFLPEGKVGGRVNYMWAYFSIFCVLKKGYIDYLQAMPLMETVTRIYLAAWAYLTLSYSWVLEEQKKELMNILFPSSDKLPLCSA